MILKKVSKLTQTFCFKGYSTVYRVLNHFPDNTSLVECINSGRKQTVPSDKQIELVPLETL